MPYKVSLSRHQVRLPSMCFYPLQMISHSSLDRWNVYAKSVQTLRISGLAAMSCGSAYYPESFGKLSHVERPIFPSLHAVLIHGDWLDRVSAPSILAIVLSQSVRHFEIDIHEEMAPRKILETIHQHSPGLRYLTLGGAVTDFARDVVCELLPSFLNLQFLCLDTEYANTKSLAAISPNLPQLRVLYFQSFATSRLDYDSIFPTASDRPNGEIGVRLPSLTSLFLHFTLEQENYCHFGDIIGGAFGRNHRLRLLSVRNIGSPFNYKVDADLAECVYRYCKSFSLAFPFLEIFRLDHSNDVSHHGSPFKVEVVEPLLRCTELTELSLLGFKVLNTSEFTRILTCLPKLVKLVIIRSQSVIFWLDSMRNVMIGPVARFIDDSEEVAERKLEGVEGVGLDCLAVIRAHLPLLKMLWLTLVASPTEHLDQSEALQPFENLETLEFSHSFWNFRLPGFDIEKAAQFVSSFMNSRTGFVCRVDEKLEASVRDGEEPRTPGDILFREYATQYNNMCGEFQKKVNLARLDERERLVSPLHTRSQLDAQG
jgi:hypothetical protein